MSADDRVEGETPVEESAEPVTPELSPDELAEQERAQAAAREAALAASEEPEDEEEGFFDKLGGWFGGLFENDNKNETDAGFDLNNPDGKRRDESAVGQGYSDELGGELRENEDGTLHYEGDLGAFDYDASQWAVCLRENGDGDRSPVLRYIGTELDGDKISVPEGVTKLDYAFTGKEGLTSRPAIPSSVVSLEGTFNGCTGMEGVNGTEIDTSQGSGVTAEGKIDSNEELYARETGIGTKSTEYDNISYKITDGMTRVDQAAAGQGLNPDLGGTITEKEEGVLHYSGYLGEFDYNTKDWAVGTRTTVTEDGYSAEVPVLRYVGGKNGDDNIVIPNGVKVLDFTFEGNEKLSQVPVIPEGVESAHSAFANCKNLKQACENAKDNEHQAEGEAALKGGVAAAAAGTGLGVIGSTIGGAVAAGAAAGSIAPGVGTAIGAGVGLLGGVGYGVYTYVTRDGKGGEWYLPSSLKDTSYMFDNCDKLTEAAQFGEDSSLMNTQGMYRGNDDLGSDPIANKYGSKSISDLSGTLVTTDANSHMYEGTNTDYTMSPETAEKSSSRYWNDQTGQFEDGAYENHDAADVRAAEDLSTNLEVEAVMDADVITDLDIASGGSASTGYFYDRNGGQVETTNANDQNQLDQADSSGMSSVLSLLDRGLVSIGEYKLIGMFTGANKGIGGKLIAGVATAGLQMCNVLPKSIKPVVQGVANMVGSDTQIGGMLNGLADYLPDTGDNSLVAKALGTDQDTSDLEQGHTEKISLLTEEQEAQKDSSDKTLGAISDRMEAVMDNPFGADAGDKLTILDGDKINAYMSVNARQMVKDNIFLTAANKSVNDEEFGEMSSMMELSSDALAEKAAAWKEEDGGTLSEEHRQEIAQAYIKMLEGLDAYDNAALAEIQVQYGGDPEKMAQAVNGLGKTMSASVMPVADAVLDMQSQYGIFTEEELAKIDQMQFTGINGAVSQYDQGDLTMNTEDAYGWQETHGREAEVSEPVVSEPVVVENNTGVQPEIVSEDDLTELPEDESDGLAGLQALSYQGEALTGTEPVRAARTGIYTDEELEAMNRTEQTPEEDILPGRRSRLSTLLA